MITNTRLRPEIIHNRRRNPRRALLGHRLEQILQLTQVLALARRGALDEALPGVRVGEAGVGDAVEDVVFGLDGDDGAVGAGVEVLGFVLLGWNIIKSVRLRVEEKGLEAEGTRLLRLWSSD